MLLWSYPFFGRDAFSATTITDVSVRYDPVTDTDIVTYCGASTNGNYLDPSQSGQTTMAPLFPHLAPTPNLVGVTDVYATGNVHHAPLRSQSTGQWDGIVGRVHAPHQQVPMVQTPVMRDFHSIVGGPGDDVLLGISEINETEFVTVGATQGQSSPGPHFPLTNPRWAGSVFNMNQLAQWEMGVILRFEYFPLALLNLSTSTVIGAPSSSTIAKDVIWHGGVAVAVGTTSDAVFASGLTGGFQTSFAGSATGFVVASDDLDNGFSFGSFLGAAAVGSGATGVAAWNEYPDHVAISGWTRSAAGSDSRIALYSLFRESGVYSLIRDYIIDDAPTSPANQRVDRPGARFAGIQSAFSSSPAFFVQADSTESGGLAVDERGQISVVGNVWFSAPTPNATYPVQGGAIARISEGLSFQNVDAVRTTVDMLPSGVARTDGTGDLVGVNWTMVSGDGGTTPICATEPFGNVLQVPQVERMFVDFDGQAQAGAVASVLVDRPPQIPGGVISVGALQVGVPPQSPSINPLFPGIELWLNGSTVISLPMVSNGESIREPLWGLAGLPNGSWDISIQYVVFLPQSVCGNASFTYSASPALIISW